MPFKKGEKEPIFYNKKEGNDKWILYDGVLYSKEPINDKELYRAVKLKPNEIAKVPKIINMLQKERDELLSKCDIYVKQPERIKVYDNDMPEKVVSEIQKYVRNEIERLKADELNLNTINLNNKEKKRFVKLHKKIGKLSDKEFKEFNKLISKRGYNSDIEKRKFDIRTERHRLEDRYHYILNIYPRTFKMIDGRKVSSDKIKEDREKERKLAWKERHKNI
jgi:hypothetical protein